MGIQRCHTVATRSKQIRRSGWILKMELRQAASARIPPILPNPVPSSDHASIY